MNEEVCYYVYIIECSDLTLYTGWTTNLEKRIVAHNRGRGAKYTRMRTPVVIRYIERFKTKSEAMKREYQIKQCTREEKKRLIAHSIENSTSCR